MLLESLREPADLQRLTNDELTALAAELREFIVDTVSAVGQGHLGSNLGVVELTLALHRVFTSPRDVILWDVGHQAYVHKLVTGRYEQSGSLRQKGGLSGYPCRAESDHDWVMQRLAELPPLPEEQFYSLTGRYETLQLILELLATRHASLGLRPTRYHLNDYVEALTNS